MERYCYEGDTKTSGRNVDGVYRFTEVPKTGFCIFDRKRGTTREQRLGWCFSRDDAELIVSALNAGAKLLTGDTQQRLLGGVVDSVDQQ